MPHRIPAPSEEEAAALAVQARILREMPAWRKLELVEDANRTSRALALAGLRHRFPAASEEDLVRLLMDLVLGEEAAARVYGCRPG